MKEKASRIQTSKDVGVQGFSGGKKKSIKRRRVHCGCAGDGARDRVCERWLNTRLVSFDFIPWRAELPLRQACPRSPSNPESFHSSRRPLAEFGTEVELELCSLTQAKHWVVLPAPIPTLTPSGGD